MPFSNQPQPIVVVDIQSTKTNTYTSSGPTTYDVPCAAFQSGFLVDVAAFASHLLQYAQTVQLTDKHVLVVVIPTNLNKQIKQYILQVVFQSLAVNFVRFEYRSAIMMYGESLTSAVVVEQYPEFMQVTPYINGHLLKSYISYAYDEAQLQQAIESLYTSQLNAFAKKALQNQLFFTFENEIEEQIAEKLNITIHDNEDREFLMFDGANIILKLGNLQEESYVKGQDEKWFVNL